MLGVNWLEVNNTQQLPRIKAFYAIWKGIFCIAQYDDDERAFFLCHNPAYQAKNLRIDEDGEEKFTHYCIPNYTIANLAEPRTDK